MAWRTSVLSLWMLVACAPPPEEVLAPDASRTLVLGEDGPYGVELVARRIRARVDQAIDVDVLVPLELDGAMRRACPVVLLVQGGLVGRERYRWLGIHLASRGFVVIAPGHALDLAFFEQGNALGALSTLRVASRREGDALFGVLGEGPAAIVGHSLGGVVAATAWGQSPETITHLALLASYPQEGGFEVRAGGRVLSLLGTEDGRTTFANASDGVRALLTSGVPVTFASIEGMNHMQFTDGVSADEAANDGVATVDVDEARARVLVLLDALMSDFAGADGSLLDDPSRWPDGVTEAVP